MITRPWWCYRIANRKNEYATCVACVPGQFDYVGLKFSLSHRVTLKSREITRHFKVTLNTGILRQDAKLFLAQKRPVIAHANVVFVQFPNFLNETFTQQRRWMRRDVVNSRPRHFAPGSTLIPRSRSVVKFIYVPSGSTRYDYNGCSGFAVACTSTHSANEICLPQNVGTSLLVL